MANALGFHLHHRTRIWGGGGSSALFASVLQGSCKHDSYPLLWTTVCMECNRFMALSLVYGLDESLKARIFILPEQYTAVYHFYKENTAKECWLLPRLLRRVYLHTTSKWLSFPFSFVYACPHVPFLANAWAKLQHQGWCYFLCAVAFSLGYRQYLFLILLHSYSPFFHHRIQGSFSGFPVH